MEQLGVCNNMNLDLRPFTKIDVYHRPKFKVQSYRSYKTSRRKMRENLSDFVFGCEFLDTTLKIQSIKEKVIN